VQNVLYFFLALQVQLVDLVSAVVMVIIVWSLSCFLFYSWYPRAHLFVKVGARSLCPMESAPLPVGQFHSI